MEDGGIRIAVLSDSHGWLRRCVVRELQDCQAILHAGDIIRETDLDELAACGSLYAVRGNNDVWIPGLRDLAGVLTFVIGGVRFVMTHEERDLPRDLSRADVIITGHTHCYREERENGKIRLNPGSCGRARFGGEVTMAKILVKDGKVRQISRIDFRNGDE